MVSDVLGKIAESRNRPLPTDEIPPGSRARSDRLVELRAPTANCGVDVVSRYVLTHRHLRSVQPLQALLSWKPLHLGLRAKTMKWKAPPAEAGPAVIEADRRPSGGRRSPYASGGRWTELIKHVAVEPSHPTRA